MTIPPRFMEELRGRLTLSDIIGRSVRLTRAGREHKGCCPFHNEKTPSFYVNDDKQFYHCFGCGAHGDVIGFAMQNGNLSFIEAIEALATEAGMQVPQQSSQDIQKAKEEKSLYTLLEDATRWMEGQLRAAENMAAYRYIVERGNTDEQLSAFRVGYAPHDGQAIRKAMLAKGYTDKQMIECGILRAGKGGREPYAFFRERIMFPVPDRRGRVIAYGGRTLPDHLLMPNSGDYVPAKYMNSSDTPLFDKGKMLYGEPRARQAAIDGQDVIVVEGYVDVMACVKAGYAGAVAPMGTALTEEQIMVLWRMIPQARKVPILCFDGDSAGRRAAARACERLMPLLKADHSAAFAFLPDGQDPDSIVNGYGKKALANVLEAAMPLVDFMWMYYTVGQSFDTPEARAGLSKTLEAEVLRIQDREVQHYYRQAFREKINKAFSQNYGQAYGAKGGNFKAGHNKKSYGKPVPPPVGTIKRPNFSRDRLIGQVLLAAIINHPALIDMVEEDLGSLRLPEPRLDSLRQAVLTYLCENHGCEAVVMIKELQNQGFSSEIRGLLSESVYTHAKFARPQTAFEDVQEGWNQALDVFRQLQSSVAAE